MLAKIVLHSIKMEDGMQPADSKFKYLITSALPLEESLRDTDLIKVDFQMIAKVTITQDLLTFLGISILSRNRISCSGIF
jgi:hypothetical protein